MKAPPPNTNYYQPPDWALPCPEDDKYLLEVIKNGTPLPDDTVVLSGASFYIFGRQPRGSLNPALPTGRSSAMLHPSISRVHAILQYGTGPASVRDDGKGEEEKAIPGWFIYDMKSTHGTFVNKVRNLIRLATRNIVH